MNKLQKQSSKMKELAEYIENLLPKFGYAVSVNLYLTPAGRYQGFEAHFDWMDVIVLQIAGCKKWRLYSYGGNRPPENHFPREDIVYKPSESDVSKLNFKEYTLFPGDYMYLIRGQIHEAATNCTTENNDPSVHLSIGIEAANTCSVETFLQRFFQLYLQSTIGAISQPTFTLVFASTTVSHLYVQDIMFIFTYVASRRSIFFRRSIFSSLKSLCFLDGSSFKVSNFLQNINYMECICTFLFESCRELTHHLNSNEYQEEILDIILLSKLASIKNPHRRLMEHVDFSRVFINESSSEDSVLDFFQIFNNFNLSVLILEKSFYWDLIHFESPLWYGYVLDSIQHL